MYKVINIEKVLENGTKLDIRVTAMDGKFKLDDVGVKLKGKRRFIYCCGSSLTNDYSYRVLNTEGRRKMEMDKMLEVASINLLNEALEEAWMSIKPEPLKV